MKKTILKYTALLFTILLTTSCSISKKTTQSVVYKAQQAQKKEKESYINDKIRICKYLALTNDQEIKLKELFTEEKNSLDKIDQYDEQSLARHIYKYETKFRDSLSQEQLTMYKKMRNEFSDYYFYSKWSVDAIKNHILKV